MNKKLINNIDIVEGWKKQKNHDDFHFIPSDFRVFLLVIFFVFSDLMFIHQLVDAYFYDTEVMSWLTSLVVAVLIDVSPTTIAASIGVKNKGPKHYAAIVMATIALILGFVMIGYVRINSSELIFSTNNSSLISASQSVTDKASIITKGQLGMTLLFVLIPVFTSVLSFVIGILANNDSEKKLTNQLEGYNIYNEISERIANSMEMKMVMDTDFDSYVDEKHKLEVMNAKADKEITMDYMKIMQAIACAGSPEVHRILRYK